MKVATALAPSVASSKTFSKVSIGTLESICDMDFRMQKMINYFSDIVQSEPTLWQQLESTFVQ